MGDESCAMSMGCGPRFNFMDDNKIPARINPAPAPNAIVMPKKIAKTGSSAYNNAALFASMNFCAHVWMSMVAAEFTMPRYNQLMITTVSMALHVTCSWIKTDVPSWSIARTAIWVIENKTISTLFEYFSRNTIWKALNTAPINTRTSPMLNARRFAPAPALAKSMIAMPITATATPATCCFFTRALRIINPRNGVNTPYMVAINAPLLDVVNCNPYDKNATVKYSDNATMIDATSVYLLSLRNRP